MPWPRLIKWIKWKKCWSSLKLDLWKFQNFQFLQIFMCFQNEVESLKCHNHHLQTIVASKTRLNRPPSQNSLPVVFDDYDLESISENSNVMSDYGLGKWLQFRIKAFIRLSDKVKLCWIIESNYQILSVYLQEIVAFLIIIVQIYRSSKR